VSPCSRWYTSPSRPHRGTSITKLYGSIPGVWRSFHIRHLVLPILVAAPPPFSTTYPHGGSQCVHTWCMEVLPLPPSCSTNPRGGTSAIFYYLSSRRQPTTATNVPYLYAICFHFPTTSDLPQALPLIQFTYELCHHLTSGVGGVGVPHLQFYLTFLMHSHLRS